jgi:2-dehydro-3-deoxygluconokinase
MKQLKIASVGEAMIELSVNETGRQALIGYAGDTLNTAIYLRRKMSDSHFVYFVTSLGQDQFSDTMLSYIEDEGILYDQVARHETKLPGIYSISKDDTGDRTFAYWRESSAARTLFAGSDFSPLENMDVVYFSAITLAILPSDIVADFFAWLLTFKQNGGRVAFDSNYRPKLWPDVETAQRIVQQAWELTDVGMPSIDDEMHLFGDVDEAAAITRLSSYGVPQLIVKRGEAGPLLISDGQVQTSQNGFEAATVIVDTTAAGDSFNGAFLAAYFDGQPLDDAMLAGHNMASKVIGFHGAIIDKTNM